MNRTIALFVALVILLGHLLTIHGDGRGGFAFPQDPAYVALRLGRNLVHEGQLQWNPGQHAWESHPSAIWVLVCAVAERIAATRLGDDLEFSVNSFIQATSALCAVLVLVVASRFRPKRSAGLIAPLLLATSGSLAAAAGSGTETALFALCVLAAFLAFEQGRSGRMATFASLACLVRPEGFVVTLGLLALRAAYGRAPRRAGRAVPAWSFLPPLAVLAAATLARGWTSGSWLSPETRALLEVDAGRLREGFSWLRDSVLTCASLLLLAYPLRFLLAGRLPAVGQRALLLGAALTAHAVLLGRDPQPFGQALVAALPLYFVATQEGLILGLDSPALAVRRLTLTAIAGALVASALASKEPGDIGPLRTEKLQARILAPSGSASFGFRQPLGRLGLAEEIDHTIRLRTLGIFLRDTLDPSFSVLTPWPGAVGYLSRLEVVDLLGRASPVAGHDRPAAWSTRGRADVVAALREQRDYVLFALARQYEFPTRRRIAEHWLEDLDSRPDEAGRLAAIEAALEPYELVTIPLRLSTRVSASAQGEPFVLLRRKALDLRPRLELELEGARLAVRLRHHGHVQLADLRLEVQDARGRSWYVRPTGEPFAGGLVAARSRLLVYNSGTHAVELLRCELPAALDGARPVLVRASLRNPECEEEDEHALASDVVELRP